MLPKKTILYKIYNRAVKNAVIVGPQKKEAYSLRQTEIFHVKNCCECAYELHATVVCSFSFGAVLFSFFLIITFPEFVSFKDYYINI